MIALLVCTLVLYAHSLGHKIAELMLQRDLPGPRRSNGVRWEAARVGGTPPRPADAQQSFTAFRLEDINDFNNWFSTGEIEDSGYHIDPVVVDPSPTNSESLSSNAARDNTQQT